MSTDDGGMVVEIDSKEKLRGVAGLSIHHQHEEATDVLRSLALAVGCEERGGYIFGRSGNRYPSVCRGWDRFIQKILLSDLPSGIRDAMVREAIRVGATVTLTADLVKNIKGERP
ncbi:hypothetical protein [Paractinoplanes toevensis]|uniref:Uncharacterized protein n=1 Tax=Paractinoplanes toevensis TaxID=571911 RepID=A0A919W359_9ACTN|nr:hypothetical protein [Actinoplanes toevensis]GIM88773.1 hypothetical protein Ato02nite_005660 [Actinoplanes toevensis]